MKEVNVMKAVHIQEFVKDFDEIGSILRLETNVDRPDKTSTPLKKGRMLIRVLACGLSPADIHMLEGRFFFLKPDKFPFVPCMDVCGVVEDPNGSTTFQKGNIVVTDNGMSPQGGLAEYMVVPESRAVLKPISVTVTQAAASASAITARNAVLDYCADIPNSRILILGGSGGVGSATIQLAKGKAKASFVATTSTQSDLCQSLGADRVIDYRKENWWEVQEFRDNKFDVIIDTVGGGNYVDKAKEVLKGRAYGGRFLAVTGDVTKPDATTLWKTIKFMCGFLLARPLYNCTIGRSLPIYTVLLPYEEAKGRKDVLEFLQDGSLKIVLDGEGPLPFTHEGVCQAFQKVASGHAHGKVVVSIG